MKRLILVRGLPGSGKSTLAEAMAAGLGMKHFEADHFFMEDGGYYFNADLLGQAHAWCQHRTAQELKDGNSVVVSNTFTTQKEMEPYVSLAKANDAALFIMESQADFGSVHNVPVQVIEKMRQRWEATKRPHGGAGSNSNGEAK